MALFHVMRIFMEWTVIIGDWSVPKWATSVGARTLPRMHYPMVVASEFWRSSMTSRVNAWHRSPTRRCRACVCVSDNGTELTSVAILRWSKQRQVEWHYFAPGKPQQDGGASNWGRPWNIVSSHSARPSSERKMYKLPSLPLILK